MKKDIIIWWMRVAIWLWLLAYIFFLYNKKADIIPWSWNDIIVLWIIALIALVMIYVGLAKPCFKKARIIQATMWIILILFPQYTWITDNPANMIFLHDILQVLWAIAIALSFGKICVYDKCQKIEEKAKEEEMEIIEV